MEGSASRKTGRDEALEIQAGGSLPADEAARARGRVSDPDLRCVRLRCHCGQPHLHGERCSQRVYPRKGVGGHPMRPLPSSCPCPTPLGTKGPSAGWVLCLATGPTAEPPPLGGGVHNPIAVKGAGLSPRGDGVLHSRSPRYLPPASAATPHGLSLRLHSGPSAVEMVSGGVGIWGWHLKGMALEFRAWQLQGSVLQFGPSQLKGLWCGDGVGRCLECGARQLTGLTSRADVAACGLDPVLDEARARVRRRGGRHRRHR